MACLVVDNTLHKREFSLRHTVVTTSRVNKPHLHERTFGVVLILLS